MYTSNVGVSHYQPVINAYIRNYEWQNADPVRLHNGGFWTKAIQGTSRHPAIEALKWEHPCGVNWTKTLHAFHNVVQQVSCNILLCRYMNIV